MIVAQYMLSHLGPVKTRGGYAIVITNLEDVSLQFELRFRMNQAQGAWSGREDQVFEMVKGYLDLICIDPAFPQQWWRAGDQYTLVGRRTIAPGHTCEVTLRQKPMTFEGVQSGLETLGGIVDLSLPVVATGKRSSPWRAQIDHPAKVLVMGYAAVQQYVTGDPKDFPPVQAAFSHSIGAPFEVNIPPEKVMVAAGS